MEKIISKPLLLFSRSIKFYFLFLNKKSLLDKLNVIYIGTLIQKTSQTNDPENFPCIFKKMLNILCGKSLTISHCSAGQDMHVLVGLNPVATGQYATGREILKYIFPLGTEGNNPWYNISGQLCFSEHCHDPMQLQKKFSLAKTICQVEPNVDIALKHTEKISI